MAEHDGDERDRISTAIANELITFANDKLEEGVEPDVIAAGMRHAAANFTGFAFRDTVEPLDIEGVTEEFYRFLHFYDDRHREAAKPMTPLERLVKQVESE